MPEAVLDVVAEDPEEQHVEAQVQPRAVEEHRREDRQVDVLPRKEGLVTPDHGPGVCRLAACARGDLREREGIARGDLARDGGMLVEKPVLPVDVLEGVAAARLNQDENNDVRRDEQQGDDRAAAGRVEVSERYDHRGPQGTGAANMYRFTGGRCTTVSR